MFNIGGNVSISRHLDGANDTFADDHVKWIKGSFDGTYARPKKEGMDFDGDDTVGFGNTLD